MKVFSNSHTYEIKNPKIDLWTLEEVHRITTWPNLPVGLRGKMVACRYTLVKPWDKNPNRCYLVTRISNGRLVKFSSRFYCDS